MSKKVLMQLNDKYKNINYQYSKAIETRKLQQKKREEWEIKVKN